MKEVCTYSITQLYWDALRSRRLFSAICREFKVDASSAIRADE